MVTARLNSRSEARLRQAATARDETVSEFIRKAIANRIQETLECDTATQLADVIGQVRSEAGCARHTGKAFTDIVAG